MKGKEAVTSEKRKVDWDEYEQLHKICNKGNVCNWYLIDGFYGIFFKNHLNEFKSFDVRIFSEHCATVTDKNGFKRTEAKVIVEGFEPIVEKSKIVACANDELLALLQAGKKAVKIQKREATYEEAKKLNKFAKKSSRHLWMDNDDFEAKDTIWYKVGNFFGYLLWDNIANKHEFRPEISSSEI